MGRGKKNRIEAPQFCFGVDWSCRAQWIVEGNLNEEEDATERSEYMYRSFCKLESQSRSRKETEINIQSPPNKMCNLFDSIQQAYSIWNQIELL